MLSIYLKTPLCEVGDAYLKVSSRRWSIYFRYIFMKNQSNIQYKVNETSITLIIWKRLSWGWIAGKNIFTSFDNSHMWEDKEFQIFENISLNYSPDQDFETIC